MAHEQKYGPVSPYATEKAVPRPITVGETFRAKSGRFVTLNAGYVEVADDGDTRLHGWAEIGEQVTVAGQSANVILAEGCSERFRIPISEGQAGAPTTLATAIALLGKTCDLIRETIGGVTLIQCANLAGSGEDCLTIVNVDFDNYKWVDVVFTPAKVTAGTGVA
jgi:hypothetical protein